MLLTSAGFFAIDPTAFVEETRIFTGLLLLLLLLQCETEYRKRKEGMLGNLKSATAWGSKKEFCLYAKGEGRRRWIFRRNGLALPVSYNKK